MEPLHWLWLLLAFCGGGAVGIFWTLALAGSPVPRAPAAPQPGVPPYSATGRRVTDAPPVSLTGRQ